MPGSIQSIERAAAVLRLLGGTDRPLGLHELAVSLDLPRSTVHGIVRTMREVGLVDQEQGTARYSLGTGHPGHPADRHDLRAAAMNWADALAGGTGLAVFLGVAAGRSVHLAHHVFRPDGTPQHIRTGEELPLHATALGKCLLAFAPVATPSPRDLDLHPWTRRTCTSTAALETHLAAARQRGWASDSGEYEPGIGGAAAPLRASGGLVVGALAVAGPVEELYGIGGDLRPPLATELLSATREISTALVPLP